MIFRVKYLIAGPAPAVVLYDKLKTELEENCRYNICDLNEAEVLGPCPAENQELFSVVPVTFKIDTYGYDSVNTILFDIFMQMTPLRSNTFLEGVTIGLQEIVVDGERYDFPEVYLLGTLRLIEL